MRKVVEQVDSVDSSQNACVSIAMSMVLHTFLFVACRDVVCVHVACSV